MKVQPTTKELLAMLYERLPELFDRPTQSPWVGLTNEEVDELDCVKVMWQDYESCEIYGIKEFAQAIESKLKEKNGYSI